MTGETTQDRRGPYAVAQILSDAAELCRTGRLSEAEAAYRHVLQADSGNAGAWHGIGLAVLQQGRPAEAADLIAEAVRRDAATAPYHDDLGSALSLSGRPREAAESHLRAIRLKPDSEGFFVNLGNALSALGHKQAVSAFLVALTLDPSCVKAWLGLGGFLHATGNDTNAAVALRRADLIEQGKRLSSPAPSPEDRARADDLVDRAVAAHQAGRLADAEALYRQALTLWPDHGDAGRLLGVVLFQSGREAAAIATVGAVLDRAPADGAAWDALGVMHQFAGRFEAARGAFVRAVVLTPDGLTAVTHLGVAVERCGDLDAARRWQARAVRLDPADPTLRVNFGVALERAGGFAEAARQYRTAITVSPGHAEALNNLGNAARLNGDATAEAWVRRTIRIAPNHPLANWNLGLIDLAAGRLASGWAGYEQRFTAEALERGRTLTMPAWRGDALAGRRLLVWNEQGLGDEILFSSCLEALQRLDGHVIVECDRRLVPLLSRAFPWAEVRSARRNATDADLHIAIGSLPSLFRRSLTAFPGTPWLTPDPTLAQRWQDRVAALPPGIRIGLGWRSGLVDAYRRGAYTALMDWAPVLTQPGVVVVNLQYGDVEDEIAPVESALGVQIHRWPDLNLKDDLEGVAALISALDLVAVVPTAAGELAGALGIPVWRLGGPDWTWLGTRARPWYPTMRIWPPAGGLPIPGLPQRLADELVRLRQD